MLASLHIENIAVIRRLDLELSGGFSVLTGETGAGKSIIIDSLSLLLGGRVSRDLIRTGEESATVSALFEGLSDHVCRELERLGFPTEDRTILLSRTVTADGRSRTKLDGRSITLSLQREIAPLLVSIHGQNDSQRLLSPDTHLEWIDAYIGENETAEQYRIHFSEWRQTRRRLESLLEDEAERLRLSEMLQYQIEDIDALRLSPGEEETLTQERDRLLHLEQINQQADLAFRLLRGGERGSAYDLIRRAQNALRTLEGLVPGAEELGERLAAVAAEVADIAETTEGYSEEGGGDPTARIDRLEGRLERISKLKRKYGGSIEEILAFRENAATRLETLEHSEEERERLSLLLAGQEAKLRVLSEHLSERRRAAAREITAAVTETLAFLDMPKVRFSIELHSVPFTERGTDAAEFLISTNPGEPLLPMARIASGGELSRIMLALRSVLNDRTGADTVIFDEIDTGISGKTSRKIGIKLSHIARGPQVICVTHSAQIASLADTHFRICKSEREGRTETFVEALSHEARVEEIARILGGIHITDAQRDAAREMIADRTEAE